MKYATQKLNRVSLFFAFMGLLSGGALLGCGGEETDSLQEQLIETKAVSLKQTDFDTYLSTVKLGDCTFVVAGGVGTFTPSSELSKALYGDPNGSAHKTTFAVPPTDTSTATVEVTSLVGDMAQTKVTLSGANATVLFAFHGQVHVDLKAPILGKLVSADVEFKPSNASIVFNYNMATERVQVSSVTSHIVHATKNCGGSGWCNGIFDTLLTTTLPLLVDAPLRDALNKSFDNATTTQDLDNLLVAMYNAKDKKTPAWTMVPHSLSLASGAFNFTVQR